MYDTYQKKEIYVYETCDRAKVMSTTQYCTPKFLYPIFYLVFADTNRMISMHIYPLLMWLHFYMIKTSQ